MRFEQRRCSEQTVIAADAFEYVLCIGFVECDGNYGGGIQRNHFGKPCSSYMSL